MLRRPPVAEPLRVAVTAVVVSVVVTPLWGGLAASAAAPAAGCLTTCASSTGDGWTAGAGATVTLTYRGGPGASSAPRPATVAGPPPPCRMVQGNPVQDQERAFGHGDDVVDWVGMGYDASYLHMPIGHEQNLLKQGSYWVPQCTDADPETARAFFAQNVITFVEDGTPPPPPPPPSVEQLREIAEEHLEAPTPDVSVNPEARSLVNLPTWVWTDPGAPTEVGVTAAAGGNWAEVVAVRTGMSLSTPAGRQEGSCADGGTPWSEGAVGTDCAVVFERASTTTGTWPVTVATTWAASWTDSEGGAGDLQAQSPPDLVVEIPVAEVQTLVGRG